MDIKKFSSLFGTEQACVAYLAKRRWPHGTVCDKCGSIGTGRKTAELRVWFCSVCRKSFSVTSGTPMDHTHLPLPVWFSAIFMIATSSKGVSAVVLSRQLGVSYKTAWFLGHRIRKLMAEKDVTLQGIVEVDETYIGGKRRKGQTSKRDDDDDQPTGRAGTKKMMAVTAVERDGKSRARKAKTHNAKSIATLVHEWLDPNAAIVTDELPAYRWIGRKYRAHLRVNHSKGEWSRRDPLAIACAHTNTVESFNATIKRTIMGVFHWFSIKHADRYLEEISGRWNMRKMTAEERFETAFRTVIGPLPWKELTA